MAQKIEGGHRAEPGGIVVAPVPRRSARWIDGPWVAGANRTWLLLLAAAVLPLLLFGGLAGSFSAERTRANTYGLAADKVERVARRISSALTAQIDLAQALASSTSLDDGDLISFRIEAMRLRRLHPLWHAVELSTPEGAELLHLLRPPGQTPATNADMASFRQVLVTHSPAVGGMGPVGGVSALRLVTLRVPVLRQGGLRYVLSIAMAPDSIGTILNTAGAPQNWVGVVIDASGHILARTRSEGEQLGQLGSVPLRNAVASGQNDFHIGYTLEGLQVDTVTRVLQQTGGWAVAFGIPTAILRRPVHRALLILGAAGCAGLLLATALAALVTRDMTQRREDELARAERRLQASEQRRALAIEAAELGSWRWDITPDRFDSSDRCRSMLDLPWSEIIGDARSWTEAMTAVHPQDRDALDEAVRKCLTEGGTLEAEFRVRHAAGAARWIRATGRVLDGVDRQPRSLQGVMDDVTAQKQAESDRRDLRRRLALAQEDERKRISRELHDQVGQTVTGLSLAMKALEAEAGISPARMQSLQRLVTEIGRDIHRAAADLRPSALDDLGLQRALQALAASVAERLGIRIDVQAIGYPACVSSEIETVIYRVVQEALNNVAKHASASAVSILVERGADRLRVIVEDDGIGFDTEQAGSGGGGPHLGLSGIRERLALVGGSMTIETMTGGPESDQGTTLFIEVPASHAPSATDA